MGIGTKVFKKNADYVIFFDECNSSWSISEWQEINGARKYFCKAGLYHHNDIVNQEGLPTGLFGQYTNAKPHLRQKGEIQIPTFTSIKDVMKWMEKNRVDNT